MITTYRVFNLIVQKINSVAPIQSDDLSNVNHYRDQVLTALSSIVPELKPGFWKGQVVEGDGDDMRVKVKVEGVHDNYADSSCPLADYLLPIGYNLAGSVSTFLKPIVGSYVWVIFPYEGDASKPIIVGSVQDSPLPSP